MKGCKIIVLACNTASGVCVEQLRIEYPKLLFIAIEPAIKIVKDLNEKGLTLVMATPRTLKTQKFLDSYDKYKPINCELVPCPGLANLIEEEKEEEIIKYINELHKKYPNTENFVLGCTHYPLIKDKIKKVFPKAKFYDGNKGLSEELKRKIEANKFLLKEEKSKIEFYDSSNSEIKKERFFKYLSM